MISQQQATQLMNENQLLTAETQTLKAELTLFQARCEQYSQAYDSLKEQIREMQRHRFGQRSERYIDPAQTQLNLWQDNNAIFSSVEALGELLPEETSQVSAHTRKKKNKTEKELPRRIEIIPLSDEDKQCTCGSCKTVIRYETKESVHYQPCVIEIVEQRREVAACPMGVMAVL